MPIPENLHAIIRELPDSPAAERFFLDLSERHPGDTARAARDTALLSDILTLSAFSPLLATTILQNPTYLAWLARERADIRIRTKEDLLESLARFSLMHSQIEPHDLLARFRRRELLRIYLRDIRRLATVTEITEELSNLADAILEFALRLAMQEMENRYGSPQETDERGRLRAAAFSVVALGKLGSHELNYSSDIDLLFLYSAEGSTSGSGTRGTITNREYFIKLAEQIVRIVGRQSGEGAAYRIDLRLRPHGTLGALAISIGDAVRYYGKEARPWERQVLIRSRAVAGDTELFRDFASRTAPLVYSASRSVDEALANVRSSKQLIDEQNRSEAGFNVKLGRGGIREIEFIAQALQLAHGWDDVWLRSAHTLISLSRLADRGYIGQHELTRLYDAYEFLRRLEHILQMEHGLQTHIVPAGEPHRTIVAARMGVADVREFDRLLEEHTANVAVTFGRVFTGRGDETAEDRTQFDIATRFANSTSQQIIEKSREEVVRDDRIISERIAQMLRTASNVGKFSLDPCGPIPVRDYRPLLYDAIEDGRDLGGMLARLRQSWTPLIAEIAFYELNGDLPTGESKRLQTQLAEASIEAAVRVASLATGIDSESLGLSVLGLGKLGSRGMDHESDLDVVLTHDKNPDVTPESVGKFVNTFTTALSGITREGSLYRLDMRLRPYGKNGPPAITDRAMIDYFKQSADIWEMLAFVKLRGVFGERAEELEREVRSIIHERARQIPHDELRSETLRIRNLLEKEKTRRRTNEIDIKYGPGGTLDVYFAIRHLQLRDDIPDEGEKRSSSHTIERLHASGSLPDPHYSDLSNGYRFISRLDHNLRLRVGRTSRLPLGNRKALEVIASAMGVNGIDGLLENLTIHRLNIRRAFEAILSVART